MACSPASERPPCWDIKACLTAVIIIPLIPWRYAFAQYVAKSGDPWR